MKVLHLVKGDLSGGAAKGALLLHQGLLSIGTNSQLLCEDPKPFGKGVFSVATRRGGKLMALVRDQLDKAPTFLYRKRLSGESFSTGSAGIRITRHSLYRDADVVHLHGVAPGFIKTADIARFEKPVVWTLRDMWSFTGGCHYSLGCREFTNRCGACPQLGSGCRWDLSRRIWARKHRRYPKHIVPVAISSWLGEIADESSLFREFPVEVIPNTVDLESFFPVDRDVARAVLGWPDDERVVLAGAQRLEAAYKGIGKLFEAVASDEWPNTRLVLFGSARGEPPGHLGLPVTYTGFLHDAVSLRLVYSAADVFVVPSLEEAFGKTIVESLACGTPVVAFRSGGARDILDHKRSGYLAEPFEAQGIAEGIRWALDTPAIREDLLSDQWRETLHAYSPETAAQSYRQVYERLVSR